MDSENLTDKLVEEGSSEPLKPVRGAGSRIWEDFNEPDSRTGRWRGADTLAQRVRCWGSGIRALGCAALTLTRVKPDPGVTRSSDPALYVDWKFCSALLS